LLHPNPFTNEIILDEPATVQVRNMQGQLIFESDVPKARIETSAWPAGMYIISTPEAQSKVLKLE
jgi:hypothetical protein